MENKDETDLSTYNTTTGINTASSSTSPRVTAAPTMSGSVPSVADASAAVAAQAAAASGMFSIKKSLYSIEQL